MSSTSIASLFVALFFLALQIAYVCSVASFGAWCVLFVLAIAHSVAQYLVKP